MPTLIEVKLDQLAEFYAEVDCLTLKRDELIEAVKVPEEVTKIQDAAQVRKQALSAAQKIKADDLFLQQQQALDAIHEPEMPVEYVAALNAARQQRSEIMLRFDQQLKQNLAAYWEKANQVDAEVKQAVAETYNQISQRKQEITAEFSGKLEAAQKNIKDLTDDIKASVILEGKTVKGQVWQAVYTKGRVTWNTDMLDGMCVAFPELAKARKEGAPSVSLRKN